MLTSAKINDLDVDWNGNHNNLTSKYCSSRSSSFPVSLPSLFEQTQYLGQVARQTKLFHRPTVQPIDPRPFRSFIGVELQAPTNRNHLSQCYDDKGKCQCARYTLTLSSSPLPRWLFFVLAALLPTKSTKSTESTESFSELCKNRVHPPWLMCTPSSSAERTAERSLFSYHKRVDFCSTYITVDRLSTSKGVAINTYCVRHDYLLRG